MEALNQKLYPSLKNLKNFPHSTHLPKSLQKTPPSDQQHTSSSSPSLSKEEETLLQLAITEYTDYLPNILTVKTQDFIPNVAKYIKISSQSKGIDCNEQALSKVLKIIHHQYYEKEYIKVNEIIQSITNIDKCKRFKGTNYIPHCNRCISAIHTCGDKFYHFQPYLLCLKCQKIYDQNCVLLFCKECQIEYYSSVETTKQSGDVFKPATWNKYHCNIVLNDVMKCYKCQNVLYINTNGDRSKLMCLKCKIEFNQLDIQWTCVICNNQFTCEAKEYNPLEYKTMKMIVKETIVKGVEAKPDAVSCCKMTEDEINKATFHHKKNCNGVLYVGCLNNKKIVVCDLCHMLYNYDAHLWMCPICKHRFKLNEQTQNETQHANAKSQRDAKMFQRKSRRHETDDYKDKHNSIINNNKVLRGSLPLRTAKTIIEDKESDIFHFINNDDDEGGKDNNDNSDNDNGGNNELVHSLSLRDRDRDRKLTSKSQAEGESNNPYKNNNHNSNNNSPQKLPLQQRRSELIGDFKSEEYVILKQIGQGTFGKIYEVEDKTKRKFAMKKILTNSLDEVTALINEYEMLKSLSSSCKNGLLNIHGMQTKKLDKTTHAMYVLMDLAVRDWEKEIERRSIKKAFYTEQELIKILQGLTFTFAELQRHNISHRDIKPQNILLLEDGSFRIADFGEAKRVIQSNKKPVRQTIRGTELYMSPILFHALKAKGISEKYTEHNTFKSDVFSLGLCFILAATLTFNSLVSIRELEDMISIKLNLGRYLKGRYTNKLMDVLYYMIELDEKMRFDFIELEKYVEKLC